MCNPSMEAKVKELMELKRIKADMPKARYALNDIGTALYELRQHIEALENEHRLEDLRQRKPRE